MSVNTIIRNIQSAIIIPLYKNIFLWKFTIFNLSKRFNPIYPWSLFFPKIFIFIDWFIVHLMVFFIRYYALKLCLCLYFLYHFILKILHIKIF